MTSDSKRRVLSVLVGFGLLAGCGGSQTPAFGSSPADPGLRSALSSLPKYVPNYGEQVQYVTEDHPGGIAEFEYPKGVSEIAHWSLKSTLPTAECTKGAQTFWVVEEKSDRVVEFAAGGKTPIKTLTVTGGTPFDCTVDAATGNVAVTLAGTSSVVIFTKGSGSGHVISDKIGYTVFDAYDANGNLFVNGTDNGKSAALAELPKGTANFKKVSFSNSLLNVGPLRWDGTYLAMYYAINGLNDIYRYRVSGSKANLEGTVTLKDSANCGWFWVWSEAGVLFCPYWDNLRVFVYAYPAGGTPIAYLGPMPRPFHSSVVSLTP